MLTPRSRYFLAAVLVFLGALGYLSSKSAPLVAAEGLPSELSDDAFWKLMTEFSEPGGYFRSDNFISNEDAFQDVIPDLKTNTKPGGVYLGVGPDQNFTYIVALQPKIAFIFDIRRQNMMEHLMYKALIELSSDRVDFASKLFSRKPPANLNASAKPEELFQAFDDATADAKLFETNMKAILNRLETTHGFKLSPEDEQSIKYVYRSFFEAGPEITYSFANSFGGRGRMPTYEELMMTDDGQGLNRTYMANDQNFQTLKNFEKKNLIVPLVGDFAGEKAIRSVGRYLKEKDAMVTTFYLSNVEQYLFQDRDNWKRFYRNVETLPLDSTSTFIRSVFNGMGYGYVNGGYSLMKSQNLLCSMLDTVKAFNEGRITSYTEVIRMSLK
jgi:hypothetical protein